MAIHGATIPSDHYYINIPCGLRMYGERELNECGSFIHSSNFLHFLGLELLAVLKCRFLLLYYAECQELHLFCIVNMCREGLTTFDPTRPPLSVELSTAKFTILPARDANGATLALFNAHREAKYSLLRVFISYVLALRLINSIGPIYIVGWPDMVIPEEVAWKLYTKPAWWNPTDCPARQRNSFQHLHETAPTQIENSHIRVFPFRNVP